MSILSYFTFSLEFIFFFFIETCAYWLINLMKIRANRYLDVDAHFSALSQHTFSQIFNRFILLPPFD